MNKDLIKIAAMKYAGISWGDVGTNVVNGLAVGGALFGVATIAEKIVDLVNEKSAVKQEKKYFEEMLGYYPQLQKESPEKVAALWTSLTHYAPAMAADPHSAGAFIVQSLKHTMFDEFGGLPPDTYKTLAETQKLFVEARKKDSLVDEIKKQTVIKSIGNILSNND